MIPLCRPSIQKSDIDNVVSVLESSQLVQGIFVEKLETAVQNYLKVKHAVALSSGTATLHLALLSLGIGPGDEVIVPAFSYVATANVVELTGAKPVFVDIALDSFNINPELIERAITPRTKAIMPVHEFGLSAEMDSIIDIAGHYRLAVIEDAACALGAEFHNRKVGGFGNIGSFSLHPRKAVTSGEGGVLVTDNDELASFFRVMRNHGIRKDGAKMKFVAAGFNYRMTDFQAALVVGQLDRIEEILNKRAQIAQFYDEQLGSPLFLKPKASPRARHAWQSYHILLHDGMSQEKVLHYLSENGIGANYGAQCIPIQEYYQNKYGYTASEFPNSANAFLNGITIPLFDTMHNDQITKVTEVLNRLTEQNNA